ncbi:MAG: alpha-amylase, partial [Treponema sp.]|nr:alpha-amylase [Treponema sp.]
ADFRQVREFTARLNAGINPELRSGRGIIKAGQLNSMGLIDEILHYMAALYREQVRPDVFDTALARLEKNLGSQKTGVFLEKFCSQFPPKPVYGGERSVESYLNGSDAGESNRSLSLEEVLLLALANLNPAFRQFLFLFDDSDLARRTVYPRAVEELKAYFAELPGFGPDGMNLWDLLRAPALASPDSLAGQLEYMRKHWGLLLGKFITRLLTGLDVMKEEEKPVFFGSGPTQALVYDGLENEYERFSPDQDWMPKTILIAKSTLVWLYQLSQRYGREITGLDQIPDEELDELARRGFTGLWLIGLWERSNASKTIKQWTGNPDAAASAYSLYDYDIAAELGGWGGLVNLRERCVRRGIRLGSDMVPNHTGIDSRWIIEHPGRFLQLTYSPFPGYTYNCGNLSGADGVTVQIEEHYFNRTDAAVVFKRTDDRTGEVRYIYHGNDGTSMPWNDTAQIDFLNPEAREAVIRTIIGVCQQFPIVRFDAAMTLAKRHIQRLWYPEPGHGGDIASRGEHGISAAEFNRRIPNEFWREVVDRCAVEAPHTLLLAEAFWMMEGYFVRTLGMHRVYNSAFMNMLKNEENAKYRATIKNTLEFDPEVLKRFVNFMNNPDEDTAVAQFGKGDKYFGICTLLVTMPGLPMFGHGQIEGFEEKYGMEYRRSYREEQPDLGLVNRHEREIFPLMKKRHIFSGSADFCLFDLYGPDGTINEDVFAYSNRSGGERALVFYNNVYAQVSGWINHGSVAIPQKDGSRRQDSLCQALGLHGEDRFFVLLKEYRSGLWYIRSSKEIAERGLFVSLNGYEAQVFLDIHEVEDLEGAAGGCWATRWSRLNHDLHGRGVQDIEAAILDIFLGELYAPFGDIFSPRRIEALGELIATGKNREKVLAAFEGPVTAFIGESLEYIEGTGGRYDPFVREWDLELQKAGLVWEDFVRFFDRLVRLAGGTGRGNIKDPAGLGTRIKKEPKLIAAVLGYGVLTLLRSILGDNAAGADAVALLNHWRLDRKLRECWEGLGMGNEEAWRTAELARAVLARTRPEDASSYSAYSFGKALILDNYHEEDFRMLLGVNHFEDVTWFNKEGFEFCLLRASLFLASEGDGAFREIKRSGETKKSGGKAASGAAASAADEKPVKAAKTGDGLRWEKRLAAIAGEFEIFRRAEEKSGYRLDDLIEALSSPERGKKNI